MGDVTTWNFLEHNGLLPKPDLGPDVFFFATSGEYDAAVRRVVRSLRDAGIRTAPALDNPFKGGLRLRTGWEPTTPQSSARAARIE